MYYDQPAYPVYPNYPPTSDYFQQRASQLAGGLQRPAAPPPPVFYTVSSIEEARNARIENPMSTYFFMDTNNNKIYVKKIGDNGTPIFQSYAIENPPPMTDAERIALLEKKLAAYEAAEKKPAEGEQHE